MRLSACVIALLTLAGCQSVSLEDRFLPLEEIKQSKALAPSKTGARVLGRTVFVYDIDDWMERHPEPKLSSVLKHEQVHSVRQLTYDGGPWKWAAKYSLDREFAWAEEQLGWYVQLLWARRHGLMIHLTALATKMADYRNVAGKITDYETARQFILEVMAERWRVPDDAKELVTAILRDEYVWEEPEEAEAD